MREKMIFWFLLIITVLSCSGYRLELNVTHSSYQAQEQQNVTLDWTFKPRPDPSLKDLYVYCDMWSINGYGSDLLHFSRGLEIPLRDELSERVQFDRDVLREGRIRLHVSSLWTQDSGEYRCEVRTHSGVRLESCRLSVSAARVQTHSKPGPDRDQTHSNPGPEEPDSESPGWIALYCGLGLSAAVGLVVFCILKIHPCLKKRLTKSSETNSEKSSSSSQDRSMTSVVVHSETNH